MAQAGLTKCVACGVASELHEAFQGEPNSVRKYCPPCWARKEAANEWNYLIAYVLVGAGGVGLMFVEPKLGFLLVSFFLFHVFGILATVPHELGHALAAKAFGMEVFQVSVGVGKKLFSCRILGVAVDFRAIPYGGLTLALSPGRKLFRVRQFVYALAGPMANLVVAGVVYALVGWEHISQFRPHEKIDLWTLLLGANVLDFASNLIPRSIPSSRGLLVSDGLHLLAAIFHKPENVEQQRIAYFVTRSGAARQKGDVAGAAHWIEEGLKDYPDDRVLLYNHALCLIEAQKFEMAVPILQKLLDAVKDDPAFEALLLNDYAYAAALSGDDWLLGEADRCSAQALRMVPWLPAVKRTRGTVLIKTGRVEEGEKLVREAAREAEAPWARAQSDVAGADN